MDHKPLFCRVCAAALAAVLLLGGCSGGSSAEASGENSGSSQPRSEDSAQASAEQTDKKRTTLKEFLVPEATGKTTYGNDIVSIDASNSSTGYVMINYSGNSEKAMLQITAPDEAVYTYTLKLGAYETFPLSGGNGKYHLDILEHAYDNMYAIAFSQDIEVTVSDEFSPFLYPNQYVWFTKDDAAVAKGIELSDQSSGDLDYVQRVYDFVTGNIDYDDAKAATVSAGYLPDIDETLSSGRGICFDYASLMAALLRSQGVPTKLVVGYSGTAYHAWISVYLKESGWVSDIIQFDGKNWSLMDPTLAANNDNESVGQYIGNGSNYTVKYSY